MKIFFSLLLAIGLLQSTLCAQTYHKTFGGNNSEDYAQDIIQLEDGGFAISGTTEDGLFLLRLNSEEDTVWIKKYFAEEELAGAWVKRTPDNGFILVGHEEIVDFIAKDIVLLRLDENGTILWSRRYGSLSDDKDSAVGVLIADDGFYVAGEIESSPSHSNSMLLKLDTNGEIVWSKEFGWGGDDNIRGLISSSDGGCIAMGFTDSFGVKSILLTKWSADGELEWAGTFNNGQDCHGYGISATSEGYMISGATGSTSGLGYTFNGLLIHLNASFEVIWAKEYSGPFYDALASTIELESGEYVCLGFAGNEGGFGNAFLMQTNSAGEFEWSRKYADVSYNAGRGLVELADGYLIVGGENASDGEIFLVRTDLNGASNCNEVVFEPLEDETTMNITLISAEPFESMASIAMDIETQNGTDINVICETIDVNETTAKLVGVYPNPFAETFALKGTTRGGSIVLYDMTGKSVLSQTSTEGSTAINTTGFVNGMYVVSYSNETGISNILVAKD
ncbi:MAG: T9SS type A sorting domain-containing protein [Flavobacteriales bacterium]